MKPYRELSRAGKLRRLGGLAAEAITQYDLRAPEIEYYTFDTNLHFRVTTGSGERFMLRLASPGWRTLKDLQSEALWLEALSRDTTLPVPRIIRARTGELVLPASVPEIPTEWNATLMSWVPGRLLGHYLTGPNLAKMGALFAELHTHGKTWQPPAGFTTRRFEHWLSRGEDIMIVGRESLLEMDEGSPAIPACSQDLLERMHQHVEAAYSAIDRADLRVIHCDLWHGNIKLHRGVLHPIDFEDTVWGFRAHDIAMAMLDLLETVGEERYATLLKAFQSGYAAHLDWPEDCLETFQIGRLLWKINWVARYEPGELGRMVERHVPVFEHYERTGQVINPVNA